MKDRIDIDASGGIERMAKTVTKELLICQNCQTKNDGAERLFHKTESDGLLVGVEYECTECGTENHNTAIIE